MRGSRKPSSSAGNRLRDALAQNRANEEEQRQQRERQMQDEKAQSVSRWFNLVAGQIPGKIDDITEALRRGGRVSTEFSFSASEAGVVLNGTEGVELESLAGFKKLDETCRDLDVECTVTRGRYGYGRSSTAGKLYLNVSVDAEQPYQPVTVERPRPPGRR